MFDLKSSIEVVNATTTIDATSNSTQTQAPDDAIFHEVVRRIPEDQRQMIETKLSEVTPLHLARLHEAMADEKNLFEESSFIHNEFFPYTALYALRRGEILPIQFGTLMSLWGNLDNILPSPTQQVALAARKAAPGSQSMSQFTDSQYAREDEAEDESLPEFIPLFTLDGQKNETAFKALKPSLEQQSPLSHLIVDDSMIIDEIYAEAVSLPKSEQGFWIIKNKCSQHARREEIQKLEIIQKRFDSKVNAR